MDKKRNEQLITIANNALLESSLVDSETRTKVQESYNGQIAALSVSIVTTGICPTLAIYYQDKPNASTPRTANRRTVLNVIANMLHELSPIAYTFSDAEGLFKYAIENSQNSVFKRDIIDSSVILKHIVRTFELVNDGKSK